MSLAVTADNAGLIDAPSDVVGNTLTNPLIKARSEPGSRKSAIRAMCAHCMGCTDDYQEPGWKGQVRACTATRCPLWNLRPYQ